MGTNTDEDKKCFKYSQSQWFSSDALFPCIVYEMHLIRKLNRLYSRMEKLQTWRTAVFTIPILFSLFIQ